VAAGVDVTVIRSWLGHADPETTNHYVLANLETKRKALEQADPKLRPAKPPRGKRDADLLAWRTLCRLTMTIFRSAALSPSNWCRLYENIFYCETCGCYQLLNGKS
jgi:hypothetical protein